MHRAICILLLLFSFTVNSYAQNEARKNEVMMKMQSLRNALLSKDSVGLSALLADDVTYVHSTGNIQTKSQLIRDVMSGAQDYKSIEPSDMNVRVYDNASIVTSKLRVSVINRGQALDLNLYATLTWVKINGDWELVARQAVRLPD